MSQHLERVSFSSNEMNLILTS